jgi:hypothetical protein
MYYARIKSPTGYPELVLSLADQIRATIAEGDPQPSSTGLAVQSISLHSTGCDKCMTMLPSRLMISQHARWVQESLYSVPSGKCCLGEERGMDTTEQVLGVLGGYLHGWFRVRGTRRHHFVLTR